MIAFNVSVKSIVRVKKDYSWNPSTYIGENSKYLKGIDDTLVIVCDEIINATDSVSTNVTSIISTNVRSTMAENCNNEKLIYKRS